MTERIQRRQKTRSLRLWPQALWFLTIMLLATVILTACGGDDGDEPETPPTPETPTGPETPTEPETPTTICQGWPEAYDGVMLQAFYWDSYTDTKWTNLEAQADELSQFFNIIWVPNSAYANSLTSNMGYHPVYWFDHKSAFGTEAELRSMIKTFKQKGTGFIEDVVINHRASVNSDWLNFPAETYKGKTYQLTAADICQDDEAKDNGFKPTGAKDTGDKWDGARDLDHTSQNVQANIKAYLDCLLNDLGYVGFRYDLVKGYAPKYTALYNATAQPQYSVGECWDGNKTTVVNWLNGTKQNGQIQSAAFDFPLKYRINAAFGDGNWMNLNQSVLANDKTYQRYAVTFIDNHDTYRESDRLRTNVCAANAYILCFPGTPCVFLKHWQAYKGTLKRLIALRKAAGITNQSEITAATGTTKGYTLTVKGSKGSVTLLLGSAEAPSGDWQQVLSGKNYTVYASKDVNLAAVRAIADEDANPEDGGPVVIPDFCTVTAGEICAFYESSSSWTSATCWAWNSKENFTGGTWPGVTCTLLGSTNKNKKVWKWSYNGTLTTMPTSIIFSNDGKDQTADLAFQNGGYYTEDGLQATVSAE